MQTLEPSLRRLKALEETVDTPEAVDGGDDNVADKLRELADKSLVSVQSCRFTWWSLGRQDILERVLLLQVDKMANLRKEELMALKQAVDAEQKDNTVLEG